MKRLITVIACIAVFMMTGCAQEPSVEQPAAPDYAGIIAQLEKEQMEYAQAWCDLDMNKISQIWAHDDDITIWGPGERERVQGWDGPNGVKAWYEAAMAPLASCDFKIRDLLIKVSTDGTAAIVTYYVDNDFVDKDGNKGKMTPRVTVVKELRDGVWKQIHGDASFSIAEIKAME